MNQEQPVPEINNDKEIDLLDLARKVWAARRRVIKYGVIGAVVGLVIGFSIPKSYVTSIKLAPENAAGAGSSSGMAGMAAMVGINMSQGMGEDGITAEIFPEIVKSTPFLLEFAEIPVTLTQKDKDTPAIQMTLLEYVTEHQRKAWWKYVTGFPGQAIGWILSIGADKTEVQLPPVNQVDMFNLPGQYRGFVGALSSMLSVEADKASSLITTAVTMQDPLVSAIIADSLVSKLQQFMTVYKTHKTRYDLDQNVRQYNEARVKYIVADDKLVEIIDQNRNISSESLRVRIERLRDERDLTFSIYNQMAQQVEVTKIKLQEETPIATVIEPAIVPYGAVAPNKMLLLVAFAFLGGFIVVGTVVVKSLLSGTSVVAE